MKDFHFASRSQMRRISQSPDLSQVSSVFISDKVFGFPDLRYLRSSAAQGFCFSICSHQCHSYLSVARFFMIAIRVLRQTKALLYKSSKSGMW